MELKANELRLNNLCYRTNKLTKEKILIELTASCILDISVNGEMSSFIYEPIPLTEEWLLKFGFRHVMNNWYNLHVNGNTFNIYIFEDKRYRIEIVSQSIGVFEFVHNLQNLYFALTNKELEIKI